MKTILDNHIRLHINPVHLQTKTPENALFSGVWRPQNPRKRIVFGGLASPARFERAASRLGAHEAYVK